MATKKRDNLQWLSKFTAEQQEGSESSIIPTSHELPAAPVREQRHPTRLVAPQMLVDNPYQHRFDYKNIDTLAEKMRQLGFTGSLRVRPHPAQPGYYQLAYGHRRKRAAELAEVQVPIEVVDLTDEQMILLAVSENFEREDLNQLEEGNFFLQMNDDFGMSQEAIAAFVGEGKKTSISRGYVNNRIAAARLARDHRIVREFLEENPNVNLRAINYLVSLNETQMAFVLNGLKQQNWTADHAATVVEALKAGGTEAEALMGVTDDQIFPTAEATKRLAPTALSDPQATMDEITSGKEPGHLDDKAVSMKQASGVFQTKGMRNNRSRQIEGQSNNVLNILKRSGLLSDVLRRAKRYAEACGNEAPSLDEEKMLQELVSLGEQLLQKVPKSLQDTNRLV